MERIVVSFKAYGHPNIRAIHKSTFELTTDNALTPRGDCIIGVSSQLSAYTLPSPLKRILRNDNSLLIIILEAGGIKDMVCAYGSKDLTLTSRKSIVIRKSGYIDDRTVGIYSNKSAKDINRGIIRYLKKEGNELKITLHVIKI